MKDQPRTLAIKLNNCATNDPCAICGDRTDPELGPELFLEGTWALVCYECGGEYAPELVDMLFYTRHAKNERARAREASGSHEYPWGWPDYDDPLYHEEDEGGYWNQDGFWVFSRQTLKEES
jgi:hypothetical protein